MGPFWEPLGAHPGAKMGQVGGKMALRWRTWRQDRAKMANMRPKMANLTPFGGASGRLFGDLGRDLGKNRESLKTNNPPSLLLVFLRSGGCYVWPLGRYVGASWRYVGPSWRYVGLCWSILGHLGAILRHLGDKMRPKSAKRNKKVKKSSQQKPV